MTDKERLKKYNEERHSDALLLAVLCYDEYRHDPEVKLKKFARYLERCRESNLKWQKLNKKIEDREMRERVKMYGGDPDDWDGKML